MTSSNGKQTQLGLPAVDALMTSRVGQKIGQFDAQCDHRTAWSGRASAILRRFGAFFCPTIARRRYQLINFFLTESSAIRELDTSQVPRILVILVLGRFIRDYVINDAV
jgi:hypothetical protein